jgi:hypothetical protein
MISEIHKMPHGWLDVVTPSKRFSCKPLSPGHLAFADDACYNSQTPTLNARPIKRAIKHACRRGVDVILYLDLGEYT